MSAAGIDLRHPYLTEQLIAYLGNKRALLPFLHDVFAHLELKGSRTLFLDPFAGSGAVARLARMMGFAVEANDWEYYSFIINTCHLGTYASELAGLFADHGGLAGALAELNGLPSPSEDGAYISRHYAPRSTEKADWRTERLFYTRENGLIIDAVRERIEEMYPGTPEGTAFKEKAVLIAALLYQAATHTNTSGVFKACHRGFGGHGRDALGRIMKRIEVRAPLVVDARWPAAASCMDAQEFLAGRSADICYLDPPYAVHQYGSNYFMLNTIARWDRPPVSEERGPDGRLRQKAGIRADWKRTRSAFCYRDTAAAALRGVVGAADCRWLVVSYSNEGLIGLEELCGILAETGSLSVVSTGYVKYPGGKQSLERTTRNIELALVVDRHVRPSARTDMAAVLRPLRLARLMGGAFDPARVRAAFAVDGDAIIVARPAGGAVRLPMRRFWRFHPDASPPCFPDAADAERFLDTLSACALSDVRQEIDVLSEIIRGNPAGPETGKLAREILRLANKLAHRKNSGLFTEVLKGLREIPVVEPELTRFHAGLDRIAQTAVRRMPAP
ncbi:MAG: DNA adenine methylase [Spirochaetia bacterium]|jgi:adenine-specific DNA-methyltransferase